MLINFFIYIYIYHIHIYGWLRKGMLVVQTNSPSSPPKWPATSATTTTKAFVESPEIVLVVWKATYVRGATGGGVLMA